MGLQAGLKAYWKLDESSGTRIDSHGSNDLADNNTVGSATGKIGNAADFVEANTEFLSIADNADLSTGDEDMSITCWVNLDDLAGEHRILSKWTSQVEYLLEEGSTADRFRWWVGDGSGNNNVVANTHGATSAGAWAFIFAYVDAAANELGISVNDGGVDTATLTVTLRTETIPFIWDTTAILLAWMGSWMRSAFGKSD